MQGRVLIVAGSDSGGGAGIQADIKAVTALDGFAATAITALTAQNTLGVHGVVGVEPAFIQQQMRVVLDDIGADAVKTGMLHDSPVIEAVAEVLESLDPRPSVVADPVMVAQTGDPLLLPAALETLKARLLPLADLLTPNLHETERLVGRSIETPAEMAASGRELLDLGCRAVLVKGGHMSGETLIDVLVTAEGAEEFSHRRVDTKHLHGTGCTLASAIAVGLAQGLSLRDAVIRGRAYLLLAIKTAPGLGAGSGPINHSHAVKPFSG